MLSRFKETNKMGTKRQQNCTFQRDGMHNGLFTPNEALLPPDFSMKTKIFQNDKYDMISRLIINMLIISLTIRRKIASNSCCFNLKKLQSWAKQLDENKENQIKLEIKY